MNYDKKVTEYINNNSPQQILLLEALRKLIHNTIPETNEDLKWGIPVFKKSKIFTYLRCTKNHIALGIYNINKIKDPNGVLEGSGKNMRHLKIKKIEEIDEELITEWLKATSV